MKEGEIINENEIVLSVPGSHLVAAGIGGKEKRFMKKEDIEKKYNELVKSIETKRMYDGRGKVDRYTCDTCGHIIYTTYRDKGVTPFTMRCNRCGGTKYHDKTYDKKTVPGYVNVMDWYRPTLEQTLSMPEGMIQHVLDGGLMLEE